MTDDREQSLISTFEIKIAGNSAPKQENYLIDVPKLPTQRITTYATKASF
jgi:hypothetical protein